MSNVVNPATSSSESKRSYQKGRPMTASERQLAAIARKRKTHKEVKVFVRNPLKDLMIEVCEKKGITQAQFIEDLLERELVSQGMLDAKTSHS
ncbi:replication protein (plasmid) [Citrobacter koseri]|uniref:replication regulatory protein RepA n=1 Tax=Citrobacter TaxID=544 RepID=UPI000CE67030|nr:MULTISPECIES: replication regulatory protein RepA [Citrobacter]AVE61441.1 replication protein [Citrobacter koseri]QMD64658.1 replication regulatory protein RepA [Citrobacter sp. RHB35-C17]HBL7007473.1 replication regulatory protein RepA [Citrobacter koseri]